MPSTPTRRRLLAACGAVATGLLGGCTESLPTSRSDSAAALSLRLVVLDGSLLDRHVVDLDETRPTWDERAFQAALNGTAFTTQYRKPFPQSRADDPVYTRHDGTYYHLDNTVVDQETVIHSMVRIYEVGEVGKLNDPPEHVAHTDLPQIDKRAVSIAYMAARARGNPGGVPRGLVQRGGYVYRGDDPQSKSSLLAESGPSHVSYRDRLYRVETATGTFHEAVYRPDIEPVATSEAQLERALQAQLVDSRLDPDALSADEREIVREARDNGYQAAHPYPDPLDSLLRKLDQRAYIDGNISKDSGAKQQQFSLLKYGETYFHYRIELQSD